MLHNDATLSKLVIPYLDVDSLLTLRLASKQLKQLVNQHQLICYQRQSMNTRAVLKTLDISLKHMAARRVFSKSTVADQQISLFVNLINTSDDQRAATYRAETARHLPDIEKDDFTDSYAAALAFGLLAYESEQDTSTFYHTSLYFYGSAHTLLLCDEKLLTLERYIEFGKDNAINPVDDLSSSSALSLLCRKQLKMEEAVTFKDMDAIFTTAFLNLIQQQLITFSFVAAVCRNSDDFNARVFTTEVSISALTKYKDSIAKLNFTVAADKTRAVGISRLFNLFQKAPAVMDAHLSILLNGPDPSTN